MIGYAIRRVLLLPPTVFLASLVLFLVLNLAPGRPGAEAVASGQAAAERESWRAFRAQFHLDLPVLWNTRPWLGAPEVRRWVARAAGLEAGATPRQRQDAEEALDDGGDRLVLPLLAVIETETDPEILRLAAARLGALTSPLPAETEARAGWRARRAELEARYGLSASQAAWVLVRETRFAHYWANLLRLDFGRSVVDRAPVIDVIGRKLGPTLSLTILSLVLAYLIAIPLGVASAAKPRSRFDRWTTAGVLLLYSLPSFFLATVLLRVFSEGSPFRWLPPAGFSSVDSVDRTALESFFDVLWHLCLPVAIYTMVTLATLSRYARVGVLEVVRSDFVRAARARGLSELAVMVQHAARNGMIPVLTLLGSLLPVLFSGSVVIEVVFGIPGMGLYLYESISARDYNAVMGVLVIASALTMIGILISDLLYAALDPRVSFD